MMMKAKRFALLTGCLSLSLACLAHAEEPEHETLVIDLDNPSGVAVHSETGNVYTASRFGVHRYEPKDHKAVFEVSGFPTDVYGKGPKYNIGPLGVGFLGDKHIVVGDGSRPDGEELVRVYELNGKKKSDADAVYTLGPIVKGEQTAKGEGNFYGVAVNESAIFVTCNGDDTKGWVSKADIAEGKPGELKPFIATKEATGTDAPVAITFSPDGSELVVGQMGEMNVPSDSLLTFYDPATGELKRSLKTELSDIAGLAYSPETSKLYAVDFSWVAPENGGLFELAVDGETVTATKIMSLDKPTSLAFGKEGQLYVTQFGSEPPEGAESAGSLIEIKAGL
ncbi:hypothetical protein Pla110_04710 [Polystyrenella longa]|uniref:SMP-30/Gluconolaconase/LRE-like region n=1 Tax=Polystyrenella longa TaxID=2528007 RepID=A0A518CHR6_9PLAN|nr:hypothetical protein [Polystyrenella longa]QDU78767.1 hypothetical protein Pla110_04710 [Polystyrenella longa]